MRVVVKSLFCRTNMSLMHYSKIINVLGPTNKLNYRCFNSLHRSKITFKFVSQPSTMLYPVRPSDLNQLHAENANYSKLRLTVADIMQTPKKTFTRRLRSLIIWLSIATALSSTMPLLYRSLCFQDQGLLNNDGNHPLVAPLPLTDKKAQKRLIQVDFDTCIFGDMEWEFRPSQKRIVVTPGETALCFFTAKNTADRPVLGYAVYTVAPPELGQFVNKVQCFCFEEQMLSPGETVDLPVLFYVDPSILNENRMNHLDRFALTYIFCESESKIPEEYLTMPYIREQIESSKRSTN